MLHSLRIYSFYSFSSQFEVKLYSFNDILEQLVLKIVAPSRLFSSFKGSIIRYISLPSVLVGNMTKPLAETFPNDHLPVDQQVDTNSNASRCRNCVGHNSHRTFFLQGRL